MSTLETIDAALTDATPPNARAMTLSALADHIVSTHHAYLREALPRLIGLSGHVAEAHGRVDPRLAQICQIVVGLSAELSSHMRKEELVLFPLIRQLESGCGLPPFHCGTLANPIRQMVWEHDDASHALAQIRQMTDDYTVPQWADERHRALVRELQKLEADLEVHVRKENEILFPQALALEERRQVTSIIAGERIE
jgi:regulator of cell morphogenesis and NO signaling